MEESPVMLNAIKASLLTIIGQLKENTIKEETSSKISKGKVCKGHKFYKNRIKFSICFTY